ncbi:MAG: GxxExxY protein [bacterium]
MPIKTEFEPRHISEEGFRELDFQIMGLAFDIQNEMGRFWSEEIYRNELAYRCRKGHLDKVDIEEPIKVSFKDFTKTYFIDLLINNSIIYELKAVNALVGEHKNQALNYLFLAGLNHGKLLNMRSHLVQSEFISTRISFDRRFDFTVGDSAWKNLDDDCAWLKNLIVDLLSEWGAYLDIQLYYETICHFRGGEEIVVQKIRVASDERRIGGQKMHVLNNNVAFKISAILKDQHKYEEQLHKFLRFTPFKAIQWINFSRDHVAFKTVSL